MMRTWFALSCLALPLLACDKEPAVPAAGSDAGVEDSADATVTEFDIDLFDDVGHTFRFTISKEQAEDMEEQGFDPGMEDQYTIGGGTYADELWVTDSVSGQSFNFGKVELKLIGQSSQRPWKRIPNLRVDMDEFQPGLKIDGVEHFRLNNGQVGGIYREAIALAVWRKLGYPVPRTSFAWGQAPNQWGEEVSVPYTLVEVYKPNWCEHEMSGGCKNVWESAGGLRSLLGQCQFDVCEDTRLTELVNAVESTPFGPGFEAATEQWIDWDSYRTFQCLGWITGTGDDYVRNQNNIVLAERNDGKMQFLPYSVDISAGQDWYPNVALTGYGELSQGCTYDPVCWKKLLTRCDELLTEYETSDIVETVVKPKIAQVAAASMERAGDESRAEFLITWYTKQAATLRADTIWQSTPCQTDEICAGREDGKTVCQGFCVEPGSGCFDKPCPDGFFCNDIGECIAFEPF